MKRLIFDVDETICTTINGDYKNSKPITSVIEKMWDYKQQGFEICLSTSRNMKTYNGNSGKIAANTLPILIEWLNKHNVPYDEIYIAKPWCGFEGFYVDDKAIRPDEFVNLSYEEIINLTTKEQV
ncbi:MULTISPECIES: HAD family hydrolase [Acinetobacter]|uniref:capsular biosynthesis protein n=1 Tax=Acinetobacter TaxID=469 RepID=UPI000B3D3D85|nr:MULTISPECIES: capsular biosynthesis protein [Acinetobacter]AXY59482.1 capsular biosynthesis protein [Acinetobacter sp. WCHAc010052]WOE42477.1 capsular biosynthesis protein [Acinetobacter chinensis]